MAGKLGMRGGRLMDLSNQTFGWLKALKIVGKTKHGNMIWLCACTCGKQVEVTAGDLRSGHTQSCGCTKGDRISQAKKQHGQSGLRDSPATPEFRTWASIRQRCGNEKNPAYKYYGGKGIRVCKRWDKFENFLADMGPRPGPEYSIERKRNNGPYSPRNCIWATKIVQMNNRSNSHFLEFKGERKTIAQWTKELGFTTRLIGMRLKKGWSVERALTEGATATAITNDFRV